MVCIYSIDFREIGQEKNLNFVDIDDEMLYIYTYYGNA